MMAEFEQSNVKNTLQILKEHSRFSIENSPWCRHVRNYGNQFKFYFSSPDQAWSDISGNGEKRFQPRILQVETTGFIDDWMWKEDIS